MHLLARLVLHPAERCIVHGVQAALRGSGENQLNPAMGRLDNQSQSQFRFGIAHPALAGNKGNHIQTQHSVSQREGRGS